MSGNYPFEHPLTLVVPHGRGGSTDTAVRIVTRNAKMHLGVPVRVLNLAGINGSFALNLMVDSIIAKSDGYSLSTANSSIILSPMVGVTKYCYMDEIKPIAMSAQAPFFLAVPKQAPWATLEELIADAKQNPGSISYGHSGVGNVSFVIAVLFELLAEIELSAVSCNSGRELADLAADVPNLCLFSNGVDLKEQLERGEVRVLAVAGYERSTRAEYSNAPTFLERGLNIVAYLRQGIGVSHDIPEEAYRLLVSAFEKMICDPETVTLLEEAGMDFCYKNGEDYYKLWQSERLRWDKALSMGVREKIKESIKKNMQS